jgi:hypothetical protein
MRELCPQPTRHISLCEALDRLLNTGVVALGEVTLSVADVDLIYLGLQLVVTSIESGRHLTPPDAGPQPGPIPLPPNPDPNPNLRDGPPDAGPQPGPNSRGCPRPMPSEERPTSQAVKRPPSAALPLPLADQTGSLPSGALGEKTELVANAIADSNRQKNGLGQLVFTLMKLLHELLQRQALRRIEGGALTPAQVERLGVTLMNQAREIERLRNDFGLPEEDLNLDLGPLGKLL